MYGVWWVRQYKCTECGGCANLNVQSVVGFSIQMYRVWWMGPYKCTEGGARVVWEPIRNGCIVVCYRTNTDTSRVECILNVARLT